MAGLWHLSQQQIVDSQGRPIAGARAYFYAAETLTPLDTFKDYSLGVTNPNPLPADGYGRWPVAFLDEADEFFRYRLTTPGGSVIVDLTTLPIIGPTPSEGGGGEVPVDPDALFDTGDLKFRLDTGSIDGWVRVNGRTIGSATSGASERANADTEALFSLLWDGFSNSLLPVSGGRGANAAADFAANKTITLPSLRGRTLAGLDDMGNTAANLVTALSVSPDGITLGASGGAQQHTLLTAEAPSHTHTGTTDSNGAHTHDLSMQHGPVGTAGDGRDVLFAGASTPITLSDGAVSDGAHTHTFTSAATGGGGAHNNLQPTLLATAYVKL